MYLTLLLATLPAAAAPDTPAPEPPAAPALEIPPEIAGLNASEQLITLHLMATAHAVDILSADMPLDQRAAQMQELTERMKMLRDAYRQLDPHELAAAEDMAISHEQAQRIAMQFMARMQYWAARDFDGSATLRDAVFGFLEAENRHHEETEAAPAPEAQAGPGA